MEETSQRAFHDCGFRLGHFTDLEAATGCTVILAPAGAAAGVDVRGAAPATRETDLLAPWATVERVHGLLLTGGSAFGLAAASGVVEVLEGEGIGVTFGGATVPVVPAAAIFDLAIGDGSVRPGHDAGRFAARAALDAGPGEALAEGSAGAGAGATVGKAFGIGRATKGGLGLTTHRFPGGETIGALAVVNALGDVFDPSTGVRVAGCRGGENARPVDDAFRGGGRGTFLAGRGQSTTLVAVLTDVTLSKTQCTVLARMAHDGLARAISPAHTPLDGDAVFALSSCLRESELPLAVIGHVAALVTAEAIVRAVRLARGLGGVPGLADE